MLVIGLTGGIGSGKTAVSDQFQQLGINIIDTDIISRQLINHNQAIKKNLVNFFGDRILNANKEVDRKKLAQVVFNSEQNKRRLEALLHPAIRNEVKSRIREYKQHNPPPDYLIIVVPLLLETDFTELVDRILVVIAEEKLRIERIKQRDQRPLDEIHAIISSQVDDSRRISVADDIVENNNSIEQLAFQVKQLDEKYQQLC